MQTITIPLIVMEFKIFLRRLLCSDSNTHIFFCKPENLLENFQLPYTYLDREPTDNKELTITLYKLLYLVRCL